MNVHALLRDFTLHVFLLAAPMIMFTAYGLLLAQVWRLHRIAKEHALPIRQSLLIAQTMLLVMTSGALLTLGIGLLVFPAALAEIVFQILSWLNRISSFPAGLS